MSVTARKVGAPSPLSDMNKVAGMKTASPTRKAMGPDRDPV